MLYKKRHIRKIYGTKYTQMHRYVYIHFTLTHYFVKPNFLFIYLTFPYLIEVCIETFLYQKGKKSYVLRG